MAAYPDDDDRWSGISVVKAKIGEVQAEAVQHNAAVRIQCIQRRKKAVAVSAVKRHEKERLDAMTPAQRQAIIEQRKREAKAIEAGAQVTEDGVIVGYTAEEEQKPEPAWMGAGRNMLGSTPWTVGTVVATTWALFASDIALWLLPKSVDFSFAVVTFIVFIWFLAELLGNLACKREYGALPWPDTVNMFFILDVVGTFSLIPDFLIVFTGEEVEVPDNVILARVARAARIGARLSRLTKILRMFGGNANTEVSATIKKLEEDAAAADQQVGPEIETKTAVTSKISAQVTEGISKKVIVLVIVLLVFVPIFTYMEPRGGLRTTKNDMLQMLRSMDRLDPTIRDGDCWCIDGNPVNDDACLGNWEWQCECPHGTPANTSCNLVDKYLDSMQQFFTFQGNRVIYFTWDRDANPVDPNNHTVDPSRCKDYVCESVPEYEVGFVYDKARIEELRVSEIRKYGDNDLDCEKYKLKGATCNACDPDDKNFDDCVDPACIKVDFKVEAHQKETAAGYDCALHVHTPDHHQFGGMEFWIDYRSETASEALLNIVYMLFICLIFAVSSLVFMLDLNKLVIEPVENMSKAMALVSEKLVDLGGSAEDSGEANYIENSILKIVTLLKVSFGEAGTRIIANNMSSGTHHVQALIPGVRVFGVFGMVDIREFTAATEALREKVTIFVNEFGEITHSECKRSGGSPNKNIGDAFLCVWLDKDGDDAASLVRQL